VLDLQGAANLVVWVPTRQSRPLRGQMAQRPILRSAKQSLRPANDSAAHQCWVVRLYPVVNPCDTGVFRAMGATEYGVSGLHAVADYFTATGRAFGSQGVDGAFKAVEGMAFPFNDHFNRFVVVVSAHFAFHIQPIGGRPLPGRMDRRSGVFRRASCSGDMGASMRAL